MTSNRPYLLRAIHDWINDNGLTPHLLVDASVAGVRVPPSAIKDGRVVLSVAPRAVARFEIGTDSVRFMARFSGVSQPIEVPMAAVLAIYAQENGQGMMFPAEPAGSLPPPEAPEPEPAPQRPRLHVVK
ncbi:MAG: ClpXP protease specificity-enhancing factor [Xanthomonadales bacterium]|jgi:stringent starvation protein B|nr:ClpXP protease specificity-enhancing factor [Xanthomonadales bacterium]